MNTHGADGSPVGGGEILQYWGNNNSGRPSYLDEELIKLFNSIPYVKFFIFLLLLLIMSYFILKLFNINSPFKGKGISTEINNMNAIRKRDARIVRANKLMAWATAVIEHSPFAMPKSYKEYWEYNLIRAGIKIPGKIRYIKATEFHAIIQICAISASIISILVMILLNAVLGVVMIISVLGIASVCPMMVVRQMVIVKDLEIKENFADFYLMLHYVIIASASTPLSGVMKSYAKTTSSKEMQRLVDVCVSYIDTYGEYDATRYIAKDYRELPEVGKLMRLIRQANEGGEVKAELMGFRSELLKAKQYAITKRMEKIVAKAQRSFNVLMIVLIQAVVSAMAIYIPDLGLAKGLVM